MSSLLFGKVYYKDHFAGLLKEEPGDRSSFTYDEHYLQAGLPSIAHTLPCQSASLISQAGLPAFFDNLVAEGWLETAQTRLLGKRVASRFELLLAFGEDCAGAVSVVDPRPVKLTLALLEDRDQKDMAVMASRASLSGVQPKLTAVLRHGKYIPAKLGELSTHIVKFHSSHHADLVFNEYVTTAAFKALLPYETVVDLIVGEVSGFSEPALIIPRFDRTPKGKRIHFEEFNQLLGQHSRAKYEGAYKDMVEFIRQTPNTLLAENYRLFLRIITGILLGNTDMHLKNFAMLHTENGLRLAPVYDQVASVLYQYKTMALAMGGVSNRLIGKLKPAHIIQLGREFQLSNETIYMAYEQLAKQLEAAKDSITEATVGSIQLKTQLMTHIGKRWNGTFNLIGKHLLQKR